MPKQSKTRDSFPTSLGQAGAQPSQESRAPPQVTESWGNKHHQCKCLPLPCPPSFAHWSDTIWSGKSLWPVGVSCPGCVSSQLLVSPGPHWWGGKGAKMSLALFMPCSAITETSLCYQHCSAQIQNTATTSCWEEI